MADSWSTQYVYLPHLRLTGMQYPHCVRQIPSSALLHALRHSRIVEKWKSVMRNAGTHVAAVIYPYWHERGG